MGYNGHVYRENEYVEVNSPDEVKRLTGYGCVVADPEKKEPDVVEVKEELPEVKKVVKDYIPSGKRKGVTKK